MHATQLLDRLDNLRRETTLCDVILQAPARSVAGEAAGEAAAESHGVSAHRAVLAAASSYFLAMFTRDFKERMETVITIQEVEPAALHAIVEYIYSPATLTVTAGNASTLLSSASLLDVAGVRDAATAFMERTLAANNAISYRALAELHACIALEAVAARYIDHHFELVIQENELLELSTETLAALLDSLTMPAEEHVLDAVVRWTQHHPQERQQHLVELLRHVRLPLIPHEVLAERACAEPLATAEYRVQRTLIETLAFQVQGPERRALAAAGNEWYCSRRPRASALLVVGGKKNNTGTTRDVLAYDLSSGRWQSAAALPETRYDAGVALLENRVYIVGGYGGGRVQSSMFVYDVARASWTAGPALRTARQGPAAAALGGRLYVAGGLVSNKAALSSMEALDPREGVWRPVANMAAARVGVGVVTLDGRLYATGGYNDAGVLNTVERYDPSADRWEPAESMSQRRCWHGVVAVEDALYAVGGGDGSNRLRSVERYRVGCWEPSVSMPAARSIAAVTTHAGRIYAAGGRNESGDYLSTVAVFDPATSAWSQLPAAMPEKRGGAVAVVVDWPPPAP